MLVTMRLRHKLFSLATMTSVAFATYNKSPFNAEIPFLNQGTLRVDTKKLQHSSKMVFVADWCKIPDPPKAAKGGEDACFVSSAALSVADGVGGWAQHGVDPSRYSNALMENVSNLVGAISENASPEDRHAGLDPTMLVTRAWEKCKAIVGSATVCVATLDGPQLRLANVGDSGAIVMRRDAATGKFHEVLRTTEQVFGFNFPHQIGGYRETPPLKDPAHPMNAQKLALTAHVGDVIVLGSDGLFDNVFDDDIIEMMNKAFNDKRLPDKRDPDEQGPNVATELALMAYENANNRFYMSPFAVAALQDGQAWFGGKQDDITVVVGVVVSPPQESKL